MGDAGVVMDVPTFFKYAFGPNYGVVEKYIPFVEKSVPRVVKEAVATSSCADFCNCSRFDASRPGLLHTPVPRRLASDLLKSSAAFGFGTDDPVTNVLETIASGSEPKFESMNEKLASSEVDEQVALKLAKKYAMYKIAAICAAMDGKCGDALSEDDVVFVAAAQDMRTH